MEVRAYFDDIHQVIIEHLKSADHQIVAAVAWFTDRDIFDAIYKRTLSGVRTTIALLGDDINKGSGALNFERLTSISGEVIFLPPGSRTDPVMHNKFCVIDHSIIITGSYNWTFKARSNAENITVITQAPELAGQFLDQFDALAGRSAAGGVSVADAEIARRRIEMIRNMVLLNDLEDMPRQLQKLRPIAAPLRAKHIISAIEQGEYPTALALIESYLSRSGAVVLAVDIDIQNLRFQLQILEMRVAALRDEKAELERHLVIFNSRHDHALGDLIRSLLKARAELRRMQARRREREVAADPESRDEAFAAAEKAEAAERDYREYAEQHEERENAGPLPRLDEAAERELRNTYRKACMLCHPDKVSEASKEMAHVAFIELQEAYRRNDLSAVKTIYESLKAGGVLHPLSTVLSAVESLRAAIAELEHALVALTNGLIALKNSGGVKLMDAAGDTESDWDGYFARQRKILMQELRALESAISAERLEAADA